MIKSLREVLNEVEDIYGFKPRGSKGSVRFKSEEAMWTYMRAQKGTEKPTCMARQLNVHTQSRTEELLKEMAV